MSVDILITSLRSWEIDAFPLFKPPGPSVVLHYGSPRSLATSQEQFSGEADSACKGGASHPTCRGLF